MMKRLNGGGRLLARVRTFALMGMECLPVTVEVDIANGLPHFDIVGLPQAAVRESRERVRAAIRNAGLEFPMRRITVNLAPADLRKDGPHFDLPIAVGVLAAQGILRRPWDGYVFAGELALDGHVRPVAGALAMALGAGEAGCAGVVLPAANAGEARAAAAVRVVGAEGLAAVVAWLAGGPEPVAAAPAAGREPEGPSFRHTTHRGGDPAPDLAVVAGQEGARRALEVAAAGGHNLLMVGPPGSGKTLLASCLPGLLPPLEDGEAVEVSRIYSVAGLLPPGAGLLRTRPFRRPHHSTSTAAILGGGPALRPGEITLAHRGILFLDEMPEFPRDVLEALRQPLEEGRVMVARARGRAVFPARCMLVAAMNPCPCGYLGDGVRTCICTPAARQRYRARVSGPLLDRIDLQVQVPRLPVKDLTRGRSVAKEASAVVRARVEAARARQRERWRSWGLATNAELGPGLARQVCRVRPEAMAFLARSCERLALTARAYDRILKIARTIADLAAAEGVESRHVAEALQYRFLDRPDEQTA